LEIEITDDNIQFMAIMHINLCYSHTQPWVRTRRFCLFWAKFYWLYALADGS